MKIVGIITEYNPLHNGHLKHLEETLKDSKADILICILSGNYTMRGDLSIISKMDKAKLAIKFGVDIVLELPLAYTIQSMKYFSYGAIMSLAKLGVTDLYFGTESNDLTKLEQIRDIEDNPKFKETLAKNLNSGNSFIKAYALTIKELLNIEYSSNDILAVSYLRTIKENNLNIKAHTIKREGSSYLDQVATSKNIASASAIRLMENKEDYVPKETLEVLQEKNLKTYYPIIRNILLTEDISNINLVSEGIDKHLKNYSYLEDYDEFLTQVVTKRYSLSRIKRILVNVLLHITKEEILKYNLDKLDYVRVLKMNKKGQNYLASIKKNLDVDLVTNFSNLKSTAKEIETKASIVYDYKLFKEELKENPIVK